MNGAHLLEILTWAAERLHEDFAGQPTNDAELVAGLNSIAQTDNIDLPDQIPSRESDAVSMIRAHFQDDVSLVSATLSYLFPKSYFFYRVSTFDRELISGLNSILEGFRSDPLPFDTVGGMGFDRYLRVNSILWDVAAIWSDRNDVQSYVCTLLYRCLAPLFIDRPDSHRAWVMATRPEYWAELDAGEDECVWSGRKEMQPGDLVFMYRTAPSSALTNVLVVNQGGISIDPWFGWDGIEVGMDHLGRIPDIPIQALKSDAVLRDWGAVRKNFQGVVTESIPPRFFNRLLEALPGDFRESHGLRPEKTLADGLAGDYRTEAEFENQVIVPLVRAWGLRFKRQVACEFRIGTSTQVGVIDFLLSDDDGPLTLFENKLSITTESAHSKALKQAMSYALQLGLPSLIVAAPEGMWLYSLFRGEASLEFEVAGSEVEGRRHELLATIRAIRDSG